MNNNDYFVQPQQQQQQNQYPNQGLPGYGYPIQQPGYAPQQPYVANTQPYVQQPYVQPPYGQQPDGQAPQPRINAQPLTPQGAYQAYTDSVDATEKLEEMDKVLDMINGNGSMDGEIDIKDAAIAETLARRDIDAVIIQMEHLADIVKTPEKWFPKDKQQYIPKFKESLEKLSVALNTYITKLKVL